MAHTNLRRLHTVTPVRKLCFFLMLTSIVAFAAMEHRQGPSRESCVTAPASPSSGKATSGKCGICPGAYVPVQSANIHDLATGKLLVATRSLVDPNFARTVVLLIQYDEKSAVGLVLNRRTNVPLSRMAEGLPGYFYLGGPVEPHTTIALLKAPVEPKGAKRIFDDVHLVTSSDLFDQTVSGRPDPSVFHIYQGYAGWIPHQLEREVARGSWLIFPATANAVFTADPDSLWRRMIQKTEIKVAETR
jgi:putative transcriptional regulator